MWHLVALICLALSTSADANTGDCCKCCRYGAHHSCSASGVHGLCHDEATGNYAMCNDAAKQYPDTFFPYCHWSDVAMTEKKEDDVLKKSISVSLSPMNALLIAGVFSSGLAMGVLFMKQRRNVAFSEAP